MICTAAWIRHMASESGRLRIGIIGAGAVGLGCALHLQRAGHQIVLFDRLGPGAGASFGNAGVIATSEVLPLGRPSVLRQLPKMLLDPTGPLSIRLRYLPKIAPWLMRFLLASRPAERSRISAALAALLSCAAEDWRDAVAGTDSARRLTDRGWLRLYGSAAALGAARRDIEMARRFGVPVDVLTGHEAHELEPALAPVFAGAAFFRGAWNIDSPGRMLEELAERLSAHGCRIEHASIDRIIPQADGIELEEAVGIRHRFDRVVLAAGAWSRRLLRPLGTDMPLDTERGYHLMLRTPEPTITRSVTIVSPGYTLSQMEGGLRITTAVEFAGLDAPPNFQRIRRMTAHLATVLKGIDPEPLSAWLGFRPSMPDSLPVIGPLPRHPNVIVAFGHGHVGLTLGPTTGRMVAAMMGGMSTPVPSAPYLPRIGK